jgi:UDP-N-acetylmuramoyl-tripeptide--D-alanyl-D-alanine ligase
MGFDVVAITGSVGKTTTRRIVYHVLSQHFRVSQAPKNFNNNIGLPLTLLGADPQDKIVVAEIGSSYPGEIAHLSQIAAPDVAVVTNVHPAHLAGFGDVETILQEKLSIAEGLSSDGVLIINGDLEHLRTAAKADDRRLITFGLSDACDIQAKAITCRGSSTTFTIDNHQVRVPLPGRGNIENAIAAWAVCRQFGLSIEDFARALTTLPAVAMRAELLQIGTLTVLNDCYNANPASMKNALDIITQIGADENRRLVFVCGDMAELAEHSHKYHDQLGRQIANANVRLLLAVGEFAKTTAQAAKTNANYDLQTKCFEDAAAVCNNLQKLVEHGDIVLIKGSRAAGLEKVVKRIEELFSPVPSVRGDAG